MACSYCFGNLLPFAHRLLQSPQSDASHTHPAVSLANSSEINKLRMKEYSTCYGTCCTRVYIYIVFVFTTIHLCHNHCFPHYDTTVTCVQSGLKLSCIIYIKILRWQRSRPLGMSQARVHSRWPHGPSVSQLFHELKRASIELVGLGPKHYRSDSSRIDLGCQRRT